MKRFLLMIIALFAFTATAFAYKVGDIIVVNGELGIVITVTSDGQHGKVLSIEEGGGVWDQARDWCTQLVTGWRMPTTAELLIVARKRVVINSSLVSNGFGDMSNGTYWSLDICKYDSSARYVVDVRSGESYPKWTDAPYSVRAVCAF